MGRTSTWRRSRYTPRMGQLSLVVVFDTHTLPGAAPLQAQISTDGMRYRLIASLGSALQLMLYWMGKHQSAFSCPLLARTQLCSELLVPGLLVWLQPTRCTQNSFQGRICMRRRPGDRLSVRNSA